MRKPKSTTVFWVLVCVWIACIFSFSATPPQQSHQQSDRVQQIIQPVVDSVVSTFSPGFSLDKIFTRKLGHITEYALLGILLCGALDVAKRSLRKCWMPSALLLSSVALVDETIQIWSGRSSSLEDVWVDLISALIAFWAVTGLIRLILKIRHRGKKEKFV